MNINKYLIKPICSKPCLYQNTCIKLPAEVVKHKDREGIDIFIFGIGSGAQEEKLGHPFCGPSGSYMRSIILHLWKDPKVGSFNIALDNNVKFHPIDSNGKNRTPTPEEIAQCNEFLVKNIEDLDPKVIFPVGINAACTFIKDITENTPVGKIRGNRYEVKIGSKTRTLICSYHPSYLLRMYNSFQPEKNREYDVCFITDLLDALEV
jgi:uracil-DNA glycosylase family 4